MHHSFLYLSLFSSKWVKFSPLKLCTTQRLAQNKPLVQRLGQCFTETKIPSGHAVIWCILEILPSQQPASLCYVWNAPVHLCSWRIFLCANVIINSWTAQVVCRMTLSVCLINIAYMPCLLIDLC